MVCTFFGHRNTPCEVENDLREIIKILIEDMGVSKFYVGDKGNFDSMVRRVLKDMKSLYPSINYEVVLAYFPKNCDDVCYDDTVYPEGFEKIHRRYAIDYRNRWMIEKSDYVITYVSYEMGNAFKYQRYAQRRGKIVVNIAL